MYCKKVLYATKSTALLKKNLRVFKSNKMLNFKTTYNAEKKIWSGLEIPRCYSNEYTLGRAALEAMTKEPMNIGQICYHNGKAYTNKELAIFSISVAQEFDKLGLLQCDVIGICASNSDFVAPLFFGAMLKCLIVSTLDVSYDKDGIKHTFGKTKPKLMFCDGSIYGRVKAALKELDLNIGIYTMKEHIKGVPSIKDFLNNTAKTLEYNSVPLKMGATQTATILCSSGTTGLPKGVTMSHEDLLNMEFFELTPKRRYLCFSTLHWLTGLYTLVQGTLKGLTRIISDKPFSTDDFFDIAEKYRVNWLLTPPSQLAMILASPKLKTPHLSSIELYCNGGSAASYAVTKRLKRYMPNATFYNSYGLSESRHALAYGEILEKTGRIGQLGKNMKIKILDDAAQKKGPNEMGEIFFKNPMQWNGYYGNEAATATACDAYGWIATGDLGYIDEHGILYMVDRKKDILKHNNFHYFPNEIEQVIHELDDVLLACVCGLPDLFATDLPAAAVVKKIGSDLSEQQIYEHVAQKMAHFNHLSGGVYFFDEMPLTATGKILRREVKKMCEQLRNERKGTKIEELPIEIATL